MIGLGDVCNFCLVVELDSIFLVRLLTKTKNRNNNRQHIFTKNNNDDDRDDNNQYSSFYQGQLNVEFEVICAMFNGLHSIYNDKTRKMLGRRSQLG